MMVQMLAILAAAAAVSSLGTAAVERVAALSPTEKVGPMHWTQDGNRVELTVDRLEIYRAIVINLTVPSP